MPWNPKSSRGNWISFSEASTLAKCEFLWDLQYRQHIDREPGQKMMLGTLVHAGVAAFWAQRWSPQIANVEDAVYEAAADVEMEGLEKETLEQAHWLMRRYERHYTPELADVKVLATELELTATLPGSRTKVMGHIDELWEVNGRIWLVERKTYGSRDRLDLIPVDPQITSYAWLARENDIDVYGIVFDGAYTYRWKPDKPTQKQVVDEAVGTPWLTDDDFQFENASKAKQLWARREVDRHPGVERPDSESFDRIWLDRTTAQLEAATDWLKATVSRRLALRRGAVPVRNIGPLCKGCRGKTTCFDGLAFPQEIQIVSSTDQAA